eukprot:g5473.t1
MNRRMTREGVSCPRQTRRMIPTPFIRRQQLTIKEPSETRSLFNKSSHPSNTALAASMTGVGLAKDIYSSRPWWSRNLTENMFHINSPEQMLHALSTSGNRLVVVAFYAKWCRSCRVLHPKLSQICAENPNMVLLMVDWDENMDICKTMGVKVLPFFHFYRRPFGRQTSFSISVSKIAKLKDAIKLYGVPLEEDRNYPGVDELHSIDLYLDEGLKTVAGQLKKLKAVFSTA